MHMCTVCFGGVCGRVCTTQPYRPVPYARRVLCAGCVHVYALSSILHAARVQCVLDLHCVAVHNWLPRAAKEQICLAETTAARLLL
jgi:hypothetical protein